MSDGNDGMMPHKIGLYVMWQSLRLTVFIQRALRIAAAPLCRPFFQAAHYQPVPWNSFAPRLTYYKPVLG